MDEFFLIVIMVIGGIHAMSIGANDVTPREYKAATAFCVDHGGLSHIDNDYVREAVCENHLRAPINWAVKNYLATP